MQRCRYYWLLTLAIAVSLMVCSPNTGLSQSETPTAEVAPGASPPVDVLAFEIYPQGQRFGDFFAPTIEAGESAELTVVLANTGTLVFEGKSHATNAFTALNGGFAVSAAGEPPAGVALWLDYPD